MDCSTWNCAKLIGDAAVTRNCSTLVVSAACERICTLAVERSISDLMDGDHHLELYAAYDQLRTRCLYCRRLNQNCYGMQA